MEPLLQNLIADSHTTTHASTLNNTNNTPAPPLVHQLPLRKRRLSSKAANDQQHPQTDPAHLLSGDRGDFGVNEVVEALRGKVEVERVFGRLMERRRRVWCGGRLQGMRDGNEEWNGEEKGEGQGEGAVRAV